MHESLIQRGCEVAKAVDAFAVAQGFGQGSPKGERCRQARACSQHQSGRAGRTQPASVRQSGMRALRAAGVHHLACAPPCLCTVHGARHLSLSFGAMHNAGNGVPLHAWASQGNSRCMTSTLAAWLRMLSSPKSSLVWWSSIQVSPSAWMSRSKRPWDEICCMAVTRAEGLSLKLTGCMPAPQFELTDDDWQKFGAQPEGAAQKCMQASCQQKLKGGHVGRTQQKDSHLACD